MDGGCLVRPGVRCLKRAWMGKILGDNSRVDNWRHPDQESSDTSSVGGDSLT